MAHTYYTKVVTNEWNDAVTYRLHYLQANGRWARFGMTEYTTYEAAANELRQLQARQPDFVFKEGK